MTTGSPRWFTSSYSDNGGACVEVALNMGGVVPVRDSKDPGGPVVEFGVRAFAVFVGGVRGR
ncbi:DUF397 domain-containing protein [Streptomyces subrutilus]|uniref:DUF397 domain-containing protein n=1 Tax=Streptomyces subrutilus TaxID=36818 RepID=UPI002E164F44|nr:DUF397 domain-containing protein [Streptomyces subrutilus]